MQTPLKLDIWLQSKRNLSMQDNIKQDNLNTIFASISKTISPTSDSFLLIMSHYEIVDEARPLSGFVTTHADLFKEMHF